MRGLRSRRIYGTEKSLLLTCRKCGANFMRWTCAFLAIFLCLAVPLSSRALSPEIPPAHGRQFWRDIAKNKYAVPDNQSAFALAQELSSYFASPDPELRDELAYSILDVWIVYRNHLSTPELLSLLDQWQDNLRSGIGETSTDSVLKRSFSALSLAALAERDLKSPFFAEDRFRALLDRTLAYLKDERDLRGFDPTKGWIHATAHTADLLAFLAANPLLKLEDQSRILLGVSERLSSAHQIFSFGEQDRLANVISTIVARKDFDAAAFHQWLTRLNELDRKVWNDTPPNDNLLKTYQNNSYMLQALAVRLYVLRKTPAVTAELDEVTQILRKR
jgi:hypothetical protein